MKLTPFILSLLLLIKSGGYINDETLQAGRIYEAGVRISSPWTGVTFTVPPGYQGYYEPAGKSFVMESATENRIAGIYAFSEAPLEAMGDVVVTLIQQQGIQLTPTHLEQPDETSVRARFFAVTEEGVASVVASVEAGQHGNAVAIAMLGAQGTDTEMEARVEALLETVTLVQPDVPDWRTLLAGKALTTSGTDSEYSPGGAGGGGSYASGTKAQMDFCGDGSYAFYTESESYFSIDGVSAQNTSSDAHSGVWSMVADLAGEVTLVLESTDGRVFYWSIRETASGAEMDGAAYSVGPSQQCF